MVVKELIIWLQNCRHWPGGRRELVEHSWIVDYSSISGHTYLTKGQTCLQGSQLSTWYPLFLMGGTQLPLSSWGGHSSLFPHEGDTAPSFFMGETQLPLSLWGNIAPTFLMGGIQLPLSSQREHSSHFSSQGNTAPTFLLKGNTAPSPRFEL